MIRPRLARHDRQGNPILDTDILDPAELAADHGWTDQPPTRHTDPAETRALVAEVVRLQGRAS